MSALRLCALAVLLASGLAFAVDDAVVVTAVRDPVKKSYRKMLEGAALFEARRAELAPAAALRFKLIARKPGTRLEGVELKVEAGSLAIPLRVASDRTFAIERDAAALKEDADVIPNRRAGSLTWRADVRTPGVPGDARRLGDLRLECEAGMKSGLISNYPAGFFGWLEELFGKGVEFCHRAAPRYLFFAERALWSVTLVDGERREVLPVERLYAGAANDPKWKQDRFCDCEAIFERTYFVPLGDASWPHDTRVELESMDQPGEAGLDTTKEMVRSALGEGVALDFASGYEVRVYPGIVFLFDPAGSLAKARAR